MQNITSKRAIMFANYIIANRATVRETGKYFNISKSTVHNDVHNRLKNIDIELYLKTSEVLSYNLKVRHIRGGESTKRLYLYKKSK